MNCETVRKMSYGQLLQARAQISQIINESEQHFDEVAARRVLACINHELMRQVKG